MKISMKADLALLVVTMFWGASCILMKIGLGGIQELNLISIRFLCAFMLAGGVFYKRILKVDRKALGYSAVLGLVLFLVQMFMTYGVKYTTTSNAGFLTCLAGVFVPLICYFVFKQPLEKKVLISISLATAGVFLLTMNARFQFNIGDILCILCSFAFAGHIIITGKLTNKMDSITLGVLQLGFVGLYGSIFAVLFGEPKLPETWSSWGAILALSVFCTAFAFIVQTVAQKYTTSTHTGLIFTLEPAFTAIFSYLFFHEVLSPRGYIGAGILLLSIVLVELDFEKLKWMKRTKGNKLSA